MLNPRCRDPRQSRDRRRARRGEDRPRAAVGVGQDRHREFARGLADLGIEIISTGGTARELAEAGIPVRSITDLTGFPEIMDGRVKTLHPKLYAGLLAVRSTIPRICRLPTSTGSSSSISCA